jgi:hypothetical protein
MVGGAAGGWRSNRGVFSGRSSIARCRLELRELRDLRNVGSPPMTARPCRTPKTDIIHRASRAEYGNQ